jgi:CRP/FNR family cyclic AMP-dependent transcriptional regulator
MGTLLEFQAKRSERDPAPPRDPASEPGEDHPNAVILSEDYFGLGRPEGLLTRLDARERELVMSMARRKTLARGQTLFRQGDPHDGIWLIESGVLRVFYGAPTGREITLAYWYPGHFVGGPEVFGGGTHMWTAVAKRPSVVLRLSGASLRLLIERAPRLAVGIIEGLVFKGKCYSTLAQMLGTRSVTERLAELLRTLCDVYGRPVPGGIRIEADFSHQDLANMVGATRQWVTMTLRRLAERGLVTPGRGQIVVTSLEGLAGE